MLLCHEIKTKMANYVRICGILNYVWEGNNNMELTQETTIRITKEDLM